MIFLMLAAVLALLASAYHIWRMRRSMRRMREVIETFDLGDFEERLAQAGGHRGPLAELAAAFSGLTSALFAGASSVTTTASSTIAEKEAQTQHLKEVFVEHAGGVLNHIEAAVSGIQKTASCMRQLAGDTESSSTQVVAALNDATGSVTGVAEAVERLSESFGGISGTVASAAGKRTQRYLKRSGPTP